MDTVTHMIPQHFTPVLNELTMPPPGLLEQFLSNLNQRVDKIQETITDRMEDVRDDLHRGQVAINDRITALNDRTTRIEMMLKRQEDELSAHIDWANEESKDLRLIKSVQVSTTTRLDWWAWAIGGMLTALGAALWVLAEAILSWIKGK